MPETSSVTTVRNAILTARGFAGRVHRRLLPPRTPILFSLAGAAGAWPRMGCEMYSQYAGFRESIDAASAIVEEVLGWSPAALFRGGVDHPVTPELAERNEIIRLGMVQIAQIDLWKKAGVVPAGVIGVSLGEVVAPYAAGAFSRDDTARILAVFAQAVSVRPSFQRMFLLATDPRSARRLCLGAPAPLVYLGSLSTEMMAVLGNEEDSEVLRTFLGDVVRRETPRRWLYHTPALQFDRDWVRHELRNLRSMQPACPIYLAAAGGRYPAGSPFDAAFFEWMTTRPFHFEEAVSSALDDGFRVVLNVGAQPVMSAQFRRTAHRAGRDVKFVHSMSAEAELPSWRKAVDEVRSLRLATAVAIAPATADTVILGTPRSAARAFEIYEELRREGPVQYLSRHGFWMILGFEEAERALANAEVFSSRVDALIDADPVLLGTDPPDHTAVRGLMARYFTPADVARRTAFAEQTAERLLGPLAAGNAFDVVREFADPLVRTLGGNLLGFSAEDIEAFAAAEAEANGESGRLYELLDQPMRERAPRSAMYQELLGSFTEDGARSLVRLLWLASTMETRRLLPLAILALLKNEAVRNRVQSEPGRMVAFFDEVVRLYPPEHQIPRRTTTDVEIGGRLLPAGSLVRIYIAAANRDPRRFNDPATIDLDAKRPSNLSFGSGVHRCLGAPLAKAQTIVALRALFRLVPDFRAIQPTGTVRWAARGPLREIVELVIGR